MYSFELVLYYLCLCFDFLKSFLNKCYHKNDRMQDIVYVSVAILQLIFPIECIEKYLQSKGVTYQSFDLL